VCTVARPPHDDDRRQRRFARREQVIDWQHCLRSVEAESLRHVFERIDRGPIDRRATSLA
jgi:hypothetical protein